MIALRRTHHAPLDPARLRYELWAPSDHAHHPSLRSLGAFFADAAEETAHFFTSWAGLIPRNDVRDKLPYFRLSFSRPQDVRLPAGVQRVLAARCRAEEAAAAGGGPPLRAGRTRPRPRYPLRDALATQPAAVALANVALVWAMFKFEGNLKNL